MVHANVSSLFCCYVIMHCSVKITYVSSLCLWFFWNWSYLKFTYLKSWLTSKCFIFVTQICECDHSQCKTYYLSLLCMYYKSLTILQKLHYQQQQANFKSPVIHCFWCKQGLVYLKSLLHWLNCICCTLWGNGNLEQHK